MSIWAKAWATGEPGQPRSLRLLLTRATRGRAEARHGRAHRHRAKLLMNDGLLVRVTTGIDQRGDPAIAYWVAPGGGARASSHAGHRDARRPKTREEREDDAERAEHFADWSTGAARVGGGENPRVNGDETVSIPTSFSDGTGPWLGSELRRREPAVGLNGPGWLSSNPL